LKEKPEMATAPISITGTLATIYGSGTKPLVPVTIQSILVTKNSQTTAGDSVVVDLSSGLGTFTVAPSVSVTNGATVKIGGTLSATSVIGNLTTNGGNVEITNQYVSLSAINVGPAGGKITLDTSIFSILTSVFGNTTVSFVDAAGSATSTIPSNFVVDFPDLTSVTATYNTITNQTTLSSVVGLLTENYMTLAGDPFNLESTGTSAQTTHSLFATRSAAATPTTYSRTYNTTNAPDGTGGVEICFLTGTLISTDNGDLPVETLRVGQQVVALVNGERTLRDVVWVGRKHTTVRAELSDDEAGYPVRVLQGALGDGVPYKDLLVTPEHSLFLDGQFVPARMLVNGRNVFYDCSITSYDYFHVETAEHSVIVADGALTESYLDTGNRRSFRQDGTVVSLSTGKSRSWEHDAAAKLTVERSTVEALYRQIEARALAAGLGLVAQQPAVTDDADLHLVADKGQIIRKSRDANGTVMFMIPAGVETVRLVSRTSRPSDAIGPFVDDRRQLGVLVGEVTFFDSNRTSTIDTHLTTDALEGWDVQEASAVRWTNGSAVLPLGKRQPDAIGMLAIQIVSAGPYIVSENDAQVAQKSA